MIAAIELFPCSGGMAEGFRRAGITFAEAFDYDPNACESYERNHGHRPIQMDVRDLLRLVVGGWRPSPQSPDLIVADPPCTPWSRAGNRLGLEDARDMLGPTVQLIEMLSPRAWLIGNVPGLDDSTNIDAVRATIGKLRALWCVDYASLDAADYGVPQHRVRPFWFGHPHGTSCLRWPHSTHGPRGQTYLPGMELAPHVTVRDALQHLPLAELGAPIRIRERETRNGHPPSVMDRPSMTIAAAQASNGGAVIAYGRGDHRPSSPDSPARTLTRNTHSDGALLTNGKHPINRADDPSFTITTKGDCRGAQGACVVEWPWDRPSTTLTTRDEVAQCKRSGKRGEPQSWNAIKLSERAAAILQGFPESWVFVGKTKRARWDQIGMAMPPALAHAVATSIERWFADEPVALKRAQ